MDSPRVSDHNSHSDAQPRVILPPNGSIPDPIVVVGMGMRLSGGIHSAEELWGLLIDKKSTRIKIPQDRFNIAAFSSCSPNARLAKTEYGHFLAESDMLEHFDTSFFPMSKTESETLDPQQKLLLEVVYECMQNAGQAQWRGQNIGCFVGVWGDVRFLLQIDLFVAY